jgi:hypothetical protein
VAALRAMVGYVDQQGFGNDIAPQLQSHISSAEQVSHTTSPSLSFSHPDLNKTWTVHSWVEWEADQERQEQQRQRERAQREAVERENAEKERIRARLQAEERYRARELERERELEMERLQEKQLQAQQHQHDQHQQQQQQQQQESQQSQGVQTDGPRSDVLQPNAHKVKHIAFMPNDELLITVATASDDGMSAT